MVCWFFLCGPRGAGIRRLTGNRKLKATYTKRERLIRHTGQSFPDSTPEKLDYYYYNRSTKFDVSTSSSNVPCNEFCPSVGRSVWDVCMDGVCIQSRSGLRQDGTPPPKKHTRNCLEVKLDANAQRGARGVSFRVANCLNRLSARCSKLGVH